MMHAQDLVCGGNRDFLDAIFPDLRPDEFCWTAQFKTPPNQATAAQWSGLRVSERYVNTPSAHVGWNHYFSVAALKPDAKGECHRRKANFSRLFCVVLDDASQIPEIEPSWVLETSLRADGSSNTQVGYRLAAPIEDIDLATRLHQALSAAGHLGADPNGNNPVRYVRLPWGWNTKFTPPYPSRLLYWSPQTTTDLRTLIAALKLDLDATAGTGRIAAPISGVIEPAAEGEWRPKARKLAWDGALRTHNDPTLGRNREIFRLGAYAARDRLPAEALEFILQEFVARMRPSNTSGQATEVNWLSERATIRRGYEQGHADGVPPLVDLNALHVKRQAEVEAFEAATGLSLDGINRQGCAQPVLIEIPAATTRAFPVPGLNEVAHWVEALAVVSIAAITQQAVLSLASIAVARTYTTPQGDPLSLYLGVCGRSVGELRYAHHAVAQALSAAGLRRLLRDTRMTSPATIYKSLLRSPATLYLSDDYGGVASFSRRQPSGLQEHALNLITRLYDGKTVQLDGPEDAGFRPGTGKVADEQPVIYAPCLSVLALIGDDQLATLMRKSETGRGALQQMLFAIGDERTACEKDPQDRPPPAWLPGYLRQLRRTASPVGADLSLADIFSQGADLPPQQVVIPFAAPLEPVYAAIDALSEDRRVRSLLLAARGTARRIAAVLAAWAQPDNPVVTAEILDWTSAYVCDRMRETLERFAILHSDEGKLTVYAQVLTKITEHGCEGLQAGNIQAACWMFRNLSNKKRGELIEQMLADGAIVEVTKKPDGRGRPSHRFVASKFVKQEEAE